MGTLYGELGVIGMRGCEGFVSQVDSYLREWRRHGDEETYLMQADCPRFGSGEAKAIVHMISPWGPRDFPWGPT